MLGNGCCAAAAAAPGLLGVFSLDFDLALPSPDAWRRRSVLLSPDALRLRSVLPAILLSPDALRRLSALAALLADGPRVAACVMAAM